MQKGVVIETTGSWYKIHLANGREVSARLKGKFRLEDTKLTNPVAVGDQVILGNEEDDASIVIQEILERKNKIIRQSPRKRRHYHIIAANVDQALIIASMKKPRSKPGFLSRVLVALDFYKIPPVIVFNKQDLYKKKQLKEMESLRKDLNLIGYESITTSAETGEGMDQLEERLAGRISVLTGPSGVGKSTILNKIQPGLDLKTEQVSNYNEKGRHTTTFARMHEIAKNSYVIDTPGIKEYGLTEIDAYELSFYFPEMRQYIRDCKFNNCQHIDEPGCAVKEAFSEGNIPDWRYESYTHMREELLIENKHYL